jgi:hypothetical protein
MPVLSVWATDEDRFGHLNVSLNVQSPGVPAQDSAYKFSGRSSKVPNCGGPSVLDRDLQMSLAKRGRRRQQANGATGPNSDVTAKEWAG